MKLINHLVCQRQYAIGLACLAIVCGQASAQSSVNLYGVLNPGISVVNNVGGERVLLMSDGVIQASRLGFRGTERLGDDLNAIFQLESGINLKNGSLAQGGVLFGRRAFVGLDSKTRGALTFGRQYSFMYDSFILLTNGVVTYNLYAFKMGDADGTGAQRMNNSVKYVSPTMAGWQVGLMHGYGEVPGSSSTQSGDSVSLTYAGSSFKLATAYAILRDSRPAVSIGTTVFGKPVNQTTFDSIKNAALGAQALIGQFDLHAIVSSADYALKGQSTLLKMFEVGAARPVAPGLTAALGYNHYRIDAVRFNQVSAALEYALSKRTSVSASFAAVKGSEGTAPQLFSASAPSTTRSQRAASIGMRHAF